MPTTTLSATKWGHIGSTSTSHAAAKAGTGTLYTTPNPTINNTAAISYSAASGRGRGLTYQIVRAFAYFDVSSITGTVSQAQLQVYGNTNGSADVIVLESTGFGGSAGSNLSTSDFYRISSTTYSSEVSTWSTSGINNITLNSSAESDIVSQNYLAVALLEHDRDYSNSDPGSAVSIQSGIGYAQSNRLNLKVTYTAASNGPANVSTFAGVSKSNISEISGVSLSSISKLSGVS